ncbi:MAG: hypothetical protein JNN30_08770 [Rhodanobacteraceae bacterium]|nr:hypothetical protein [Rhodanobacteraceae bacterium]
MVRTLIRPRTTPAPVASLALAHAARRVPLPMPRSAAFAAAIVARHGAGGGLAAPLQRVLAIPRDGTSIYAPQQHWHLAFAPRIALQLQATRERAASQASAPAAVPAHDAAAPPRPSTRIATVERILARGMRVDALRGVALPAPQLNAHVITATALPVVSATSAAPVPPLVAAAVPRVLRRNPEAAMSAASRAVPAGAMSPAAIGSTPATGASSNASVAAPFALDVEHLAERVVRVIDRRLVAARERLGRV